MPDETPVENEYEFAPREAAPEPTLAPKVEEAAPAAPVAERVCPHCGFRVLGKTPRNRCPECAGDLSASDELLQFSSPRWPRQVAAGCFLLIPSVLLHCGAMTLAWRWDETETGAACHFVAALVGVIGAWMLATPETRRNAPGMPFRWPIRLLAIGAAVVSAMVVVAMARRGALQPVPLLVLLQVILAGLALVTGLHVRALAVRIPNDSLVWWAQNCAWLVPVCALTQAVFFIMGRAKAEFMMLFMCAIPMAAGFVVMGLAACWTLFRIGMELRTCAVTAEGIVQRRIQRQQEREAKAQGQK